MSKGPGHIGRTIAATFAKPNVALSVDELCRLAYPGVKHIEKKHRVAVLRAAKAYPGLDYLTSDRSGRTLIFHVADNVVSYGMARLKSDNPTDTDAQLRSKLRKLQASKQQRGMSRLMVKMNYLLKSR